MADSTPSELDHKVLVALDEWRGDPPDALQLSSWLVLSCERTCELLHSLRTRGLVELVPWWPGEALVWRAVRPLARRTA